MSAHHAHTHGEGPVPVVCAWRRELSVDGAGSQAPEQLVRAIRLFLDDLLPSLKEQGCRLVGHIKGAAETGDGGRLTFSVTSFEKEPALAGELRGPVDACTLTINVIVFGGDEGAIDRAVLTSARRCLAPWRL